MDSSKEISTGEARKVFDELKRKSDFVFVVFYRGLWCPFCQAYIKKLASLRPSIVAAGGETLIVSAQDPDHLPEFRKLTGYDGPAATDVSLDFVTSLREKSLIDVAITPKNGYPNGMIQPAFMVIKQNDTVVEKWAIQPSIMNLGGAKDRPDLDEVWDNVQAKLKGGNGKHSQYTTQTFFQGISQMIWGKPVSA